MQYDVESFRREMAEHITLVPWHLREGVMAYCMQGRPIGHFLSAVMCNDLRDAVARGDDNSLAGLKGLVQFLHNYAPGGCWGSPARHMAWMADGGLIGMVARKEPAGA